MPDLRVEIVTFNDNEGAAIECLFDDILSPPSSWGRRGRDTIVLRSGRDYVLRHVALRAQGNVVAAARLAELFADRKPCPDYVLFYGCAGALDPNDVGHAFLVGQVSYASLGTVASATSGSPVSEHVTLKNKWLCDTNPHEVEPLASVSFREALGDGLIDLRAATSLTPAHVVATDKVIKVAAASAPPAAQRPGPPRPIYKKDEWTYSHTLAFARHQSAPLPVLVEMESFGIGMVAKALKYEDRVVIIRIVTDDLLNHATSDLQQQQFLRVGRIAVARLLKAIILTSKGH